MLERRNTGNGKQGRESRKESDDAAGGERRYDGRADAIDSYEEGLVEVRTVLLSMVRTILRRKLPDEKEGSVRRGDVEVPAG